MGLSVGSVWKWKDGEKAEKGRKALPQKNSAQRSLFQRKEAPCCIWNVLNRMDRKSKLHLHVIDFGRPLPLMCPPLQSGGGSTSLENCWE